MHPIIRIERFSKSYGDVKAVDGLSIEVECGELFGLIGPDGAGKTTTMRTIVTLLSVDEGEISVDGMNVTKDVKKIRRVVGYMPQRFSLYEDLSIDQNLNFFAELFGVPKQEIALRKKRLYEFSRLEEFADRLAGKLSGGMKQKLALSCTLIHDPILLVLDEPTTGVDPVSRNEFWNILSELKSQGVTVLVSTPYMDEALRCDRVAIMHEGKILAQGKPDTFSLLYQNHLYKLHSENVVQDGNLLMHLPGILSVQGFGDTLHIAVPKETNHHNLVSTIKQVVGHEMTIERIEPSLEDVFINLIVERKHVEAVQ